MTGFKRWQKLGVVSGRKIQCRVTTQIYFTNFVSINLKKEPKKLTPARATVNIFSPKKKAARRMVSQLKIVETVFNKLKNFQQRSFL